jgi:hypothetical protein
MRFSDVFLKLTDNALVRQDKRTGAMPSGHNGPYLDPETPVRNTAHWTQSFIAAERLSGEKKYLDAAILCADYLVGPDAPRKNAIYEHRNKQGKDSCNGLIGPAWTIEGLTSAYERFGDRRYLKAASKYFLAHPFSADTYRWQKVEFGGKALGHDMTFNHQLWFCMAGALLGKHGETDAGQMAKAFLDSVKGNISTRRNGRIEHPILPGKAKIKRRLKHMLKAGLYKNDRVKEVGYHSFNLYAFAVLKTVLPDNRFWSTALWNSILGYQDQPEFVELIEISPYGYAYNVPGFEMPFVNEVFGFRRVSGRSSQLWLDSQLSFALNNDQSMLSQGNPDGETLTARVYECSRFSNELFSTNLQIEEVGFADG